MKKITMKDVMDALNSVYTDTELTHKDVVILAGAVMPLIEEIQTNYNLLEALKEQLVEENEELTRKFTRGITSSGKVRTNLRKWIHSSI